MGQDIGDAFGGLPVVEMEEGLDIGSVNAGKIEGVGLPLDLVDRGLREEDA